MRAQGKWNETEISFRNSADVSKCSPLWLRLTEFGFSYFNWPSSHFDWELNWSTNVAPRTFECCLGFFAAIFCLQRLSCTSAFFSPHISFPFFLFILFMKSQSNWHVNAKQGFCYCFCCSMLVLFFAFLLIPFLHAVIVVAASYAFNQLRVFCFHLDYNVRAKIMTCRKSYMLLMQGEHFFSGWVRRWADVRMILLLLLAHTFSVWANVLMCLIKRANSGGGEVGVMPGHEALWNR